MMRENNFRSGLVLTNWRYALIAQDKSFVTRIIANGGVKVVDSSKFYVRLSPNSKQSSGERPIERTSILKALECSKNIKTEAMLQMTGLPDRVYVRF